MGGSLSGGELGALRHCEAVDVQSRARQTTPAVFLGLGCGPEGGLLTR